MLSISKFSDHWSVVVYVYVICRLGGPYSEKLWPRSWKCCGWGQHFQARGHRFSLYGPTLRAGSHFDISISISINISIRKIRVNRSYISISISIRMAIAQVQFTSQESKMADNEVKIGLLLLLSRRNRRRRLLMQRQTQRKPRKISIRDIFTRRKAQGDYYKLVQELKLRDIEFYFALQTRIIADRFHQLFVHLRRHVFS